MTRQSSDSPPLTDAVTIRPSDPADVVRLRRLAALDSQAAPHASEPMLVAEIDGEMWAAVSADGARRLADPFRRSAPILELVAARAEQLRAAVTPHPPRRRWQTVARRSSFAA